MGHPSKSEDNGIALLTEKDLKIYSVGISTGGKAEMRMARSNPHCKIIATTIDPVGAAFAKNEIMQQGLASQIEVKLENVAKVLPYHDNYFDYVYARLVLHYLSKIDLQVAISEIHRILKKGGKLFVVVRSVDCPEAKKGYFDQETCLTTYPSDRKSYSRYFHSETSIHNILSDSGFSITSLCSYPEQLCIDFHRNIPAKQIDILIEVLSYKF